MHNKQLLKHGLKLFAFFVCKAIYRNMIEQRKCMRKKRV